MLHIHLESEGTEKSQAITDTNTAAGSALVTAQTSGLTGAGEQDCKLSTVPVKVKSKKSHKIVETYAFLDQGNSSSFCTISLMNKLNISGRRTKIFLRTIGQEKVVGSCIVSDLEVAGLDSGLYCELPDVFTQLKMSVSRSNIPHQQDLFRWPYLHEVNLPEIDADVELLIGLNVPKAVEPIKDPK